MPIHHRLWPFLGLGALLLVGVGITSQLSSAPPPVTERAVSLSPAGTLATADQPLQGSMVGDESQVAAAEVVLAPALTSQLLQSWHAYRERFIQADGRVIDREHRDRATSEGQAYAMLRAVLIDDPDTFAKTLTWSETNLRRQTANGTLQDELWAWQWGQRPDKTWGIIDGNFATDADIDAITALILAARRWQRPDYLALAQRKLADVWTAATVVGAPVQGESPTMRYLLPGPLSAFSQGPDQRYLNPSYLAPYAFRLFAQVDPSRDWLSLVESSYALLEVSTQLSTAKLPSDWLLLNLKTGQLSASTGTLKTHYGFDAYRVWWRVKLDSLWYQEPRADAFLRTHLAALVNQWNHQHRIAAQLDLAGQPLVEYESTAQYAMLYLGLQGINEAVAQQILQEKLMPAYRDGFWDSNSAYYVQNLSWFGLYPFEQVASQWLTPSSDTAQVFGTPPPPAPL